MFIHGQCERNKGSQAALAQVSRPSVGHELPIVSFNADPDALLEHIAGRNPNVGDTLIVQHIQVNSQCPNFSSTVMADSLAVVISPALNRFQRRLGQQEMVSNVYEAAQRALKLI